jgi:hypothetical protein
MLLTFRTVGFGSACLAAFALCACSTSVLVRQNDASFAQAQAHLERTTRIVDEMNPPPAERTLFLQAEGFYRYRFELPRKGPATYVAETAAAVTDFPAFQSLAGSLDLLDLRYRAPDSAVQLWETLLARYPRTSLRPLTLYRLGWAYRSVGASGLPRRAPDAAFEQLIKEQPHSELAELAAEAKKVPSKSKKDAAAWSLIPGLGQLYLGERRSGLVRLGVAVASLVAIAAPLYVAARRSSDLTWHRDWPLLATGVGGLAVLSLDYTTSYEDAMRGVVQWNERSEADFERLHSLAP